jgi:hypothetical protein
MPTLYGRQWTRDELLRHVGDMRQVARIQASRLEGGRASGVSALDFECGDGLRFTVLPDLCMDIPYFEYRGVPLVWSSRNGIVGPTYYDPMGSEWLRSFSGGLLATCGLTQVGWPCDDQGEQLGLHGRIGNTPAEGVAYSAEWHGDDYVLSARGTMRETKVFGEGLRLSRHISVSAGSRTIHLHDRVENLGSQSTPFMILYHCNIGFPLLQAGARLVVSDRDVQPKDDRSREGLPDHTRFGPPQRDYQEQNFWHDVRPDGDASCQAALINDSLELPFARGLGLAVRWRKDQLWNLVQWKMLGEGDYVTAIEPANCHTLGRCAERELGTLEHITPGEVREFDLGLSVLVGAQEIAAFEASLPA